MQALQQALPQASSAVAAPLPALRQAAPSAAALPPALVPAAAPPALVPAAAAPHAPAPHAPVPAAAPAQQQQQAAPRPPPRYAPAGGNAAPPAPPSPLLPPPLPPRFPTHFCAGLHGALAAHRASLPEPLRWALCALLELATDVLPRSSAAAGAPADSAADVAVAVATLLCVCTQRLRGLEFAIGAVDAFAADCVRAAHRALRGVNARSAAPPPPRLLSLRAAAERCDALATLPAAAALPVGQSASELLRRRVTLFSLAPSLLGRFFEMGRCHRFLHLRACRMGSTSSGGGDASDDEDVDDEDAEEALDALSRGAATLRKGMAWEARLNDIIRAAPGCHKALSPASSASDDGAPHSGERVQFVDLTANIFATSCNCKLSRAGPAGQRTAAGRERRHGRHCAFNAALEHASLEALFNVAAPAQGEVTCLYQPKFAAPQWAYTSASGSARIDHNIVSFSKFQPDYLMVMWVDGKRTIVVVDAKASAKVKQSHRVQVAFYCMMLARFLAMEEDTRGEPRGALGTVASYGAVWRPGVTPAEDAHSAPETFPVGDLISEVRAAAMPTMRCLMLRADARGRSHSWSG
jgi:hypothetical protein